MNQIDTLHCTREHRVSRICVSGFLPRARVVPSDNLKTLFESQISLSKIPTESSIARFVRNYHALKNPERILNQRIQFSDEETSGGKTLYAEKEKTREDGILNFDK